MYNMDVPADRVHGLKASTTGVSPALTLWKHLVEVHYDRFNPTR